MTCSVIASEAKQSSAGLRGPWIDASIALQAARLDPFVSTALLIRFEHRQLGGEGALVGRASGASGDIGGEGGIVVEDHEDLREHIAGILTDMGYEVLAAADGPTALAAVEERSDFDLLLTDVVLPGGMNGRQIATRARQLRPGLKILFMTGYTQNAIVHDGRLDEGVALISKPVTYDPLGAKVRAELDGLPVSRRP
jgi:CheY-like chemotaxis protein